MKEISCNHCGDSVYLADKDERLEGYETPLQHMERTGHSPKSPVIYQCNDCENVWPYTGNAERPTCSNCGGKNVEGVDG
jgi:ribosomal protein S27AE